MGKIVHNAIVITGWDEKAMLRIADKCAEIGLQCVGPSDVTAVNSYFSLLVCPDGSKEGWAESDFGDEHRASLRHYLNTRESVSWVEVAYGTDVDKPEIVDSDSNYSEDDSA